MADLAEIRYLAASHYPRRFAPQEIEYLGSAGGFSGAQFWRLTAGGELFCLRRWPAEYPSIKRLTYIHSVLGLVYRSGFKQIPLPIPTRAGGSFSESAGHLWELAPWMPGQANFTAMPTPIRLAAGMRALAEFHIAAARHESAPGLPAASPGLAERANRLKQLAAGELAELRHAVEAIKSKTPLAILACQILQLVSAVLPAMIADTEPVTAIKTNLQPAIRDVWHDHLLFQGDEVSGIIDFGALRLDSVCGDIARLLGSLVGDDANGWSSGLAAYEEVRPLSAIERGLIPIFDRTAILLSAIHWIVWLFRDGRRFENLAAIHVRLIDIEQRLRHLVARIDQLI